MKKEKDFYRIYKLKRKKYSRNIIINMFLVILTIYLMVIKFQTYHLFFLTAFLLCAVNSIRNKVNIEAAHSLRFKTEYLEQVNTAKKENTQDEVVRQTQLQDDDLIGLIDED